jgi:hypothetical protein
MWGMWVVWVVWVARLIMLANITSWMKHSSGRKGTEGGRSPRISFT